MVTGIDIVEIAQHVADSGAVVRVVVADHKGSVPRATGVSMLVTSDAQYGTIGGGALEFDAVTKARKLLMQNGQWLREFAKVPLGPSLGQCCGGSVSLLSERFSAVELAHLEGLTDTFARPVSGDIEMPLPVKKHLREVRSGAEPAETTLQNGWLIETIQPSQHPLWIYGAGHVGRALVATLEGLPFNVTWIDTARDRFPEHIPKHADMLVAQNPADAVLHAPDEARHLVLTYSHSLDLEICHRVLARHFSALGLIGSETKRTRFIKRLAEAGVDPSRLDCPIGDRSLGKEPMAIAVGVVAELLQTRDAKTQNREARG